MSRARQTFKQSDVSQAVRAVVKAGLEVARVAIEGTKIEGTKIVVIAAKAEQDQGGAGANEWDTVR